LHGSIYAYFYSREYGHGGAIVFCKSANLTVANAQNFAKKKIIIETVAKPKMCQFDRVGIAIFFPGDTTSYYYKKRAICDMSVAEQTP
jgi:hypothetical protein